MASFSHKTNSREAWVRRLQKYWKTYSFPQFISRIGEIYEVDFGMNVGLEFSGRHLAVCLENTMPSQERMLVVPLTTKIDDYNISDDNIIDITSSNNRTIKGGVVLGEATYISKLRIFRASKILGEPETVTNPVKGVFKITPQQLKRWANKLL